MKTAVCTALLGVCFASSAHAYGFNVICKGPCGSTALTIDDSITCTISIGADYYGPSIVRVDSASATVQHTDGSEAVTVPNVSLYESFDLFEPIPIIAKPGETAKYPVAFSAHPGDATVTAHFEVTGEELYLTPTGESPCEIVYIPGTGLTQCRYPEHFDLSADRSFTVLPAGSCPVSPPTTNPPPSPRPCRFHGNGSKRKCV